jgi:adenine-specific DNA methylase
VRELVGEDGGLIAEFMLEVMNNERARNADEAGKWLADRGFGKAPLVVSAGVTAEQLLQDYFRKLSLEGLEAMEAILRKYQNDIDEVTARNQIALGAPHDSG